LIHAGHERRTAGGANRGSGEDAGVARAIGCQRIDIGRIDVFRAVAVLASALFAFGRAVFAAAVRLLAADLLVGRRATAREVERRKPLVTALISKVMVKGQCGPDAPEVAVAE